MYMAKFCKLPEDMVAQFLSRLPPKALLRFKCVRKSWCNLINSPRFVAKNLSNSMNNKFTSSNSILFKRTVLKDNTIKDKREIFLILRNESTEKKEVMLSLLDLCNNNYCDNKNLPSVVEDLIVPLPVSRCPLHLYIAGHCDGIICLNGIDDDIVLCNPAIKEFIYLPKSYLLLPLSDDNNADDYDRIESRTNAVGFGYDSKAKSYKVVRVVDFSGGCIDPSKRAEVYTLGTNSWREIETNIQSHVYWSPCFVIYFNGISYWIAYIFDKEFILSFNMSDELFHEIPLPNCFHIYTGWYTSLAVMKESVVVLTYEGDRAISNSFDIWMMDDSSGVEGLWTKYLTFIPAEGLKIPLVFLKSDELLMVTTDGRIVSYNFSNEKQRYLPIHGVEDPPYILAVLYLDKSLFVGIKVGQSVAIDDPDGAFTDRAFDANHCPGIYRSWILSHVDNSSKVTDSDGGVVDVEEGNISFVPFSKSIICVTGQERYHSLAPMYYRNAAAAVGL
nr:MYB transcription factor protein [Rosa persica]